MLKFKKIISICASTLIALSMCTVCTFAEKKSSDVTVNETDVKTIGCELLNTLIERQGKGFEKGSEIETSDIFAKSPSTDTYNYYLKWYVGVVNGMNWYWKDYQYDLDLLEVNGNKLTFNATVEYGKAASKFKCGIYNYHYNITIEQIGERYYIKTIETNEENYASFLRLTEDCPPNATPSEMEEVVANLIDDAYKTRAIFDSIPVDADKVVDMEKVHREYEESVCEPMARASYSYNGEQGRKYADKYHSTNNPYFYVVTTGDGDCTNFVSQCIWAAYGGWTKSDTNAQMQVNINSGKRMQARTSYSNWFAGAGGGGGPWENVTSLWNFATSNKSTGPKATGFNNNATYKNIVPSSILTGQVLQFRQGNSGNYRHSAYVSGGVNDSYDNIIITQHSASVTRTTLADAIVGWGGSAKCQMRQLKFTTANFDS